MRRLLAVVVGSALVTTLVGGGTADAAPRSKRPTVQIDGVRNVDGEHVLDVRARDRDGVIAGLEVWWGDGTSTLVSGPCGTPQPPRPGGTSTFAVPHAYAEAGVYEVRVQATSVSSCERPGRSQRSQKVRESVTVSPTATDAQPRRVSPTGRAVNPNPIPFESAREVAPGRVAVRYWAGHHDCTELHRLDVAERRREVVITVHVGAKGGSELCAHVAELYETEVELAGPLGDRRIVDGARR